MKEIEILVEVYDDIEKVRKSLKKYKYIGLKHTIDEYYYDPLRKALKPDENNGLSHCLRLRKKNKDYYKTYKDDSKIICSLFQYRWNNNSIEFKINDSSRIFDSLRDLNIGFLVIEKDSSTVYNRGNEEAYDLIKKLVQ